MRSTIQFVKEFYERNLFERIIIYLFLSVLIVKAVFELGLGQWSFIQSQNIQWVFYSFLAADYLISWRKVINIRVTLNHISIFSFVLFIMLAHGTFVGIQMKNEPFVILNDAVPLLMIALNVLRMQSAAEYAPINFERILTSCTILALGACFTGYLAQAIGKPSQPSIGNETVYLPLIIAGLFSLKPFPKWVALSALGMLFLTLDDVNRTTMVFLGAVTLFFFFALLFKEPVKGIALIGVAFVLVLLAVTVIPKDSKTYSRVASLSSIDLSERTGSIGERQAEWDAINIMEEKLGKTTEWLGLGFGGVYEVQFTHTYLKNYGHAHYSWSWFKLRFGDIGFIYLAVLVCILILNALAHSKMANSTSLFIVLLCLLCLVYCVTYVNSIFLLSGIQFYYRHKLPKKDLQKQPQFNGKLWSPS